MPEYVAMLRGVNVSGKNKINMEDLKILLVDKGFNNLSTYIQSGNLVFNYNGEEPKKDLERAISEEYGFEVPVLLRKYDELSDTINNNPFIGDSEFDPGHLYVTFLEDEPDWKKKEELAEFESGSDKFFFKGKEVYVYCPGGYGKTKINNNFFEKKLQTTATTRNWRTIKTLLNMCA